MTISGNTVHDNQWENSKLQSVGKHHLKNSGETASDS